MSMNSLLTKIDADGIAITIDYDQCADDPRYYIDDFSTKEVWRIVAKANHYSLPMEYNHSMTRDELDESEDYIVVYLGFTDNGYDTKLFTLEDNDDGNVRYCGYAWKEKDYSLTMEKEIKMLENDLSCYNNWANGNVYVATIWDAKTGEVEECMGDIIADDEEEAYRIATEDYGCCFNANTAQDAKMIEHTTYTFAAI